MVTSGNGNELIINTKIDIDYADAQKQLDELKKQIDKAVGDKKIKFKLSSKSDGSSDVDFGDFSKNVELISDSLSELNDNIKELVKKLSASKGWPKSEKGDGESFLDKIKDSAGNVAKRAKRSFGTRTLRLPKMRSNNIFDSIVKNRKEVKREASKRKSNDNGGVLKTVKGGLDKIGNFAKGTVTKISNVFKKGITGINSGVKKMSTPVKTFDKSISSLLRRFAGLAGFAAILGKFVSYLKQVLQRNQEFRQAMADLKGALYTLAQPLIEFIVPVIISLVKILTVLVRNLANLAANAFGKSLEEMVGNAQELYNTVQDIYKTIAGYDELNVINRDDTIYPDFSDVTDGVINILDPKTLGELLAQKINEAVQQIDWEGIGETIGKGIDWAIQFAYGLLENIDFGAIGDGLGRLLNSAIAEIDFETLGALIARGFTILPELIIGVLEALDYTQIGTALHDLFIGAFNELKGWLEKYDWEQLGKDTLQAIIDLFNGLKIDEVSQALFSFLGTLVVAVSDYLSGLLGDVWEDVKEWWQTSVVGNNWVETVTNLLNEIIKGLGNIGEWVMNNIIDPFMNALLGEEKWAEVKENLVEKFTGIWENVKTWWNEDVVGNNWVETMGNLLGEIVKGLGNLGEWAIENIIDPIMEAILGEENWAGLKTEAVNKVTEIWGSIKTWWQEEVVGNDWKETFVNLFVEILKGIGDLGDWAMENIIDPLMSGIFGEEKWGALKQSLEENADKIVKIGAPLALIAGLVLLFFGHWGVGVSLILAGASALAGEEANGDWDGLKATLKGKLDEIIELAPKISVIAGIVFLLFGKWLLGLGLILVGVTLLGYKEAEGDWDVLKQELEKKLDEAIELGRKISLIAGVVFLFFGKWLTGLGLILASIALLSYQEVNGDWSQLGKQIEKNISEIVAVTSSLALVLGLVLLLTGVDIAKGIGLVLFGVAGLGLDAAYNWEWLKGQLQSTAGIIVAGISAALLVVGIVILFTSGGAALGWGIGLILAGVAGLVLEATVNWEWLKQTLDDHAGDIVCIATLLFCAGLFLAFTGVALGWGIGLIVAGAAGVATEFSANWDNVKKSLQELGGWVVLIGGALIICGIFALVGGVIPLGIGLIVAGAGLIVAEIVANWEAFKKGFEEDINMILAIGGGLLLVAGLILIFTGAGTGLGLALLAAGAAALYKPVSESIGGFVEKVKGWVGEAKEAIQEKWQGVKETFTEAFESAKETAQEIFAEGEGKEGIAKAVAIGAGAVKKIWTGKADGTGEGGVKGALVKAWNGISGLAEKAIGTSDTTGLRGVFNTCKKGIAKIWTGKEDGSGTEGVRGAIKKAWGGITDVAEKAIGKDGSTGLGKVFQTCKSGIAKLWTGKSDGTGTEGVRGAIKKAWSGITTVASDAIGKDGSTGLGKVFKTCKEGISKLWTGKSDGTGTSGLRASLKNAWNNISTAATSSLGGDNSKGLRNAFRLAKEGISTLWTGKKDGTGTSGLRSALKNAWSKISTAATDSLGSDNTKGLRNAFRVAKEGISTLWTGKKDGTGTSGLRSALKNAWSKISTAATDSLGADNTKGLRNAFRLAKEGISTLWTGKKDGTGTSGLRSALKNAWSKISTAATDSLGSDDSKGLRNAFRLAKNGISTLWTGKADGTGTGGLRNALKNAWANISGAAGDSLGTDDTKGLRGAFRTAKRKISALWTGSEEGTGTTGLRGILNGIFGGMTGAAEKDLGSTEDSGLKGKFKSAKNKISEWWQGINGNGGLKGILSGIFGGMTDAAGDAIGSEFSPNSALGKLKAFKNKITDWFTGQGGIKDTILGVWNDVKFGLKLALRGILSLVNLGIDGINTILTPILDVVYYIGRALGKGWEKSDVRIPKINVDAAIPLAKGTVVPPNRRFLAMLGDNTEETEVVSPLSTMREAVREELNSMGITGQNQAPIILQVNGRTLAQLVWDEQQKQYKQYGSYAPTLGRA